LSFGDSDLSFDLAQDGELVEPFRISDSCPERSRRIVLRIWLRPRAALRPVPWKTPG